MREPRALITLLVGAEREGQEVGAACRSGSEWSSGETGQMRGPGLAAFRVLPVGLTADSGPR